MVHLEELPRRTVLGVGEVLAGVAVAAIHRMILAAIH
jgi:hypothetical protein